ncbi:protein CHLOROPLAST J-LIKE DOMAIN 1, chloroplastic isoform X3 [Rhododendron vialii]|uniref:protein CHLOROPLAST J-LIKE DOMAIN 1, chloroplastic isoform X3 n=1 Tax=Rhododendron vialii TaxID=182163 RepID=UPI00265F2207|nr:protein CHLOROPLAST J-LIKE DOMAIN 1, chloroplastic isoform X3 [Rhododendron vialii]
MPLAISNVLQCPSLQVSRKNSFLRSSVPNLPPSIVRFGRTSQLNIRLVCAASSAAGSSSSSGNPYEVLGVSPVAGFEGVKQAYASKRKDAQEKGDKATVAQVSKHIKYADKQPIVPWWPRFTKSSIRDIQINLAISAVFTTWIFIQRNAEYKPLEFLFFAFVYRVYEKLRQFEPPTKPKYTEDGEEEGRVLRMGKRILRSLALVVSCIAVSSFGYTSILNVMESVYKYIPAFVYYNQELFVTASSALMLFFAASYYR